MSAWNTATVAAPKIAAIESVVRIACDRQIGKDEMAAEDGEQVADEQIDGDLGGGRGQKDRRRRRRIGIGVGQPDVERKQGELQADADGDEGERREHRSRRLDGGETLGDQAEIERAGHHVEEADADNIEGCADGAEDQVLVGGDERPTIAAERDQGVARQRRDLEKDESVERVAGDRDAEQAGQRQQIHGVEPGDPVGRDFRGDALARNSATTAEMPETSTRIRPLNVSTRYSMPSDGSQPPMW